MIVHGIHAGMKLNIDGALDFYSGKVRDVYTMPNGLLVMVASNRISAFDVILPEAIPYKGQVLNQIAAHMLQATADICPNWWLSSPAPQVSIGKACVPIRVEMVIRGNLTGHAWRTYHTGLRQLCGVDLPEGLRENDFFPEPIITPSTKATEGHDEDISRGDILAKGIATAADYALMEQYTHALFARGRSIAANQGLILVDTKYEFGKIGDTVYLMDEIHTPDSSRYFFAQGFEARQHNGEKQQQLSKEFVREWLIANDFMGKPGQTVPHMSAEWVATISRRYIDLYERVIGRAFVPQNLTDAETEAAIADALKHFA